MSERDAPSDRRFAGVVALDGPSGTGKSTVARGLAGVLGARYLDTGAMYRAATIAVLRDGVALTDDAGITRAVAAHRIEVGTDPEQVWTRLDGDLVDAEIRGATVTAAVSPVSAVAGVRELMVRQQRELIAPGNIVAEGRDVGSVVWPTAALKVYLTATEDVRARRRAGELALADISAVAESLRRRDEFDSTRVVSPLRRPDGATEVDTSDLSVRQVIELLAGLARSPQPVGDRG